MRNFILIILLLHSCIILSQNNCNTIPCSFPCEDYALDDNNCPYCECADGWTPINQDGCYDNYGNSFSPGYQLFISECEYINCLELEDGWGGILNTGIWSNPIVLDDCEEEENNDFADCNSLISIPTNNDSIVTIGDLMLVPIYISTTTNINSYQLNIKFNHEYVSYQNDSLPLVNNQIFYNNNNINPTYSNTLNNGIISTNIIEIDSINSIISIAYATSQTELVNDILVYLPFSSDLDAFCLDLEFTNGFYNNQYVYPNQTSEIMINGVDESSCSYGGSFCFSCPSDIDQDMICDENDSDIDGDGITNEDDPCPENASNDDINNNDIIDCVENINCLELDCEDCITSQTIEIPSGWSYLSTYICPFNSDIENIMSDLVTNEQLIIIKNQVGDVYWPLLNLNSIGNLSNGAAYLLKTTEDVSLTIEGNSLNYDYPISINSGWSYIGYLHQESYELEYLMSPIVDNLIIVKDYQGDVYWPEFEINSIGNMEPGQGYQIKTSNQLVFSYPSIESQGRYQYDEPESGYFDIKNPIITSNNMTIGIPSYAWKEKPTIGNKIIVYDDKNMIVGIGNYREEGTVITIWGDDETTNEKDGLFLGEEMIFKLYDHTHRTYQDILITHWLEGHGRYSINGISIAGAISTTLNDEKELIQIVDVLGRKISSDTQKVTLLFIYKDGSVVKKHVIK